MVVGAVAGGPGLIINQLHRRDIQMNNTGKEKKSIIQRGYTVLISGGVLFVAGIVIAALWAIPFASTFLQENTLINQVSIEPGNSVEVTTQVTDVSRPIVVALHIEKSAEEEEADNMQQQQQVLEREQGVA
jgi:hypothetical protein